MRINIAKAKSLVGFFLFYFVIYSLVMYLLDDDRRSYWTLFRISGNACFAYFMVLMFDEFEIKHIPKGSLVHITTHYGVIKKYCMLLLTYILVGLLITFALIVIAVPIFYFVDRSRYSLPKDLFGTVIIVSIMSLTVILLRGLFRLVFRPGPANFK